MTWTMDSAEQLARYMTEQIGTIDVVVCIGTDKVVCDSLGPIVGTMLNDKMQRPLYIYGLQCRCLTALNIADSYSRIKELHPNSTILAVDAGVGDSSQIGKVQLSNHGILPGLATNRQLPCIGDIGIVGIVDSRAMKNFYQDTLYTRSVVGDLSEMIVDSICSAQQ